MAPDLESQNISHQTNHLYHEHLNLALRRLLILEGLEPGQLPGSTRSNAYVLAPVSGT